MRWKADSPDVLGQPIGILLGEPGMNLDRILVYDPEQVGSIFHHRGCSILQLGHGGAVAVSLRR